jgi:ankyrin repeat protein/L-ascorbate metabolism protein UlaG (beta-lactamase superfamily)
MTMRSFSVSCCLTVIIILVGLAGPAVASEIHLAAAEGDLAEVKMLLSQDAKLISAEDQNSTRDLPLHSAASTGQLEVIRFLVESGAVVDAGDSDRSTALHVAAVRGHPVCVAYLIEQGADLAFQDNNGAWSMSFAVSGANTEVIDLLIKAGAPLDLVTANGTTLLMNTAWRNQADVMAGLITGGANVNATDDWDRSPLWATAGNGNVEMTRALVNAGADVDQASVFGETPLLRAAGNGHTEIVSILIQAGADPGAREAHCGQTALHRAAMAGYGDCVQALVTGDASFSARDHHGYNPLDLAQRYSHDTSAKIMAAAGAEPGEDPSPCPSETGCLAVCQDHPAAGGKTLVEGGARLWYLGHSGYAVQTRNNLLVFDFFPGGRGPDEPALCNGYIDPKEIAGMNVTVFVSHEHGDHFDPGVFEWAAEVPNIRYVMGCPAETETPLELMEPRQVQNFDGVNVRTIESNDSGLGFLVEVDGLTIYHAGDHANRLQDFSGPYCAEIDWLATLGSRPDIALMPVSGCGFGDQEAVRLGVNYALEKMQPRVFIPLHSLNNEYRYEEFIGRCRNEFPGIRMVAPEHRGDHYDYRMGKIS